MFFFLFFLIFISWWSVEWGIFLGRWADFARAEEETLLVGFFGMDYVRYRDRTRVGIPFIT